MYWQIKKIQVSKKEQKNPKKFDNMIKAIKSRKPIKDYSHVLWEDPNQQQWVPKTALKWVLCHKMEDGEIR